MRPRRPSFVRAFAIPSVLAAGILIGLIAALLGATVPSQWAAWIALALPIVLTAYGIARGRIVR